MEVFMSKRDHYKEVKQNNDEKFQISNPKEKKIDRSFTDYINPPASMEYAYGEGILGDIARYSFTRLIKQLTKSYKVVFTSSVEHSSEPTLTTIKVGIGKSCEVINDAIISVEKIGSLCVEEDNGSIFVRFKCFNEKILTDLQNQYENIFKNSNFFKGKVLRMTKGSFEFCKFKKVDFENIIIKKAIKDDFYLNTYEYLTREDIHMNLPQRGVILYGPPGCGKTSLVGSLITMLDKENITRIFVDDSAFSGGMSIQTFFTFMKSYLLPAMIIFEDIDLIAGDRESSGYGIGVIGSLLSALNGLEEESGPLLVLATTNRFSKIDSAVTRPVRFDRRFNIDYPSKEDLKIILSKISNIPIEEIPDIKGKELTGSHVKEIYETAKILSTKNGKIPKDHLPTAIKQVVENFTIINPKNTTMGVGFNIKKGDDEY